MRDRVLTLPEALFIVATRGMLGLGVGLLVSSRLSKDRRRVAGSILVAVGAVTTIPAAMALFRRPASRPGPGASAEDAGWMGRSSALAAMPQY